MFFELRSQLSLIDGRVVPEQTQQLNYGKKDPSKLLVWEKLSTSDLS